MKQGAHMPMTTVRRPKGFTLVEVMIATVIFALSLMALIPLLSMATSIDRENYLNVMARALAAQQLDTMMGIDSLSACPTPCWSANTQYSSKVTDQNVDIWTYWAWNYVPPGPPGTNLANIVVDTEYSYKGQTKRFVLTSQKVTQ